MVNNMLLDKIYKLGLKKPSSVVKPITSKITIIQSC